MPSRDPLAEYNARRDFSRTPEPRPAVVKPRATGLRYFIQRHAATRLHYDFRLEWEGTLKSWAIPKGPSFDPAVKRLAVQTEDHPLSYGDFEGTIPAGEYGAGDVLLWDRGTWIPRDDPESGFARGKVHFELAGEKLRGEWVLFRLGREQRQWMLRKIDDGYARPGDDDAIVTTRPESVRRSAPARKTARKTPSRRKGRSAMPDFIAPQLATLVSEAPTGSGWSYEVKYDGYRMLARCEGGKVRLVSRNGNDWTGRLAPLAAEMERLQMRDGWLDGEIVVPDERGLTSFQTLQRALDGRATGVVYTVFDLPWADGEDLRDLPLSERTARLAEWLPKLPPRRALRLSEHLTGSGDEAWRAACKLGLEGLIGKRLDAPYVSGRTDTWIKLKCRSGQEFVIGGYTEPAGTRHGFGALLVGTRAPDGGLDYAGRVGTGFDHDMLESLHRKLDALAVTKAPFRVPPKVPRSQRVHWVKAQLVAQVEFAEWTAEGLLRQASFQGLREDKDPRTAQRERPVAGNRVGAVVVSHPERVIYTTPRITKLDVVRYYEAVGAAMLPEVKGRPLSLVRCPQGIDGQCFYQKHVGTTLPAGVQRVPIREKTGVDDYLVITSIDGLLGLAQFGNIEFHTWGAHVPKVELVDRLIFDLDPDVELPWPRVIDAALLTRGLLNELGLPTFLKTTGGKGLHVVVPLKPTRDWDQAKRFAQAVAEKLAAAAPDRFTARMAKERRDRKIFIDYLRNARGATAIAAFSLRARPGAPVAMPIAWDKLAPKRDIRGDVFNLKNAGAELPAALAAWRDIAKSAATLTVKMFRALGVEP
jgi:bifunctional non-homologous end joining protein LigD